MKKKPKWRRQAAESHSGMGRYPSEGLGYDHYGFSQIYGSESKEEKLTSLQGNKKGRPTTRSGVMGQRKSTKTRSRRRAA